MKSTFMKFRTAAANNSGAVEADTTSKHGRNPKSHMSRRNFKTHIGYFIAISIILPICACSNAITLKEFKSRCEEARAYSDYSETRAIYAASNKKLEEFKNRCEEARAYSDYSETRYRYAASNKKLEEFKNRCEEARAYSGSSEIRAIYAASNRNLEDFKNRCEEARAYSGSSEIRAIYAAAN
jgi:hypothetical protein